MTPHIEPQFDLHLGLDERLAAAFEWYRGMRDARTHRLVSAYDPVRDTAIADGSPLRNITAIHDVARLGEMLGRAELAALVARSLEHWQRLLAPRERGVVLDERRIGEPSSIAHSASLVRAYLAAASRPEGIVPALVAGILAQQRADGSYAIHFDGAPDVGIDLYPAQAMLAVLEAYAIEHDSRALASVERAFDYYRARVVGSDYVVFHANWQAQYGLLLHEHSRARRDAVRAYVFALHDRIIERGFFDRVERQPQRQATIEVACALEGIIDARAIAVRENDDRRAGVYARCARVAIDHLARVQPIVDGARRERGGFGRSVGDRTQRIDITGHAVSGLAKALRAGLA
ncbi:MAG: hypothetical protein KF773_03535 [Deltaproteobacteria bacterium]|nr:hypothetical protein [Deltaproteobacteria bacterium]